MSDEVKAKISELLVALGAIGEMLGVLRENLITNGYTREEAVSMCTAVLVAMTTGKGNTE